MATSVKVKKDSIAIRERATRDYSPKWDGCAEWPADQFGRRFREAMKYYNFEHNGKDLKPQVIKWMAANGYDKSAISAFKKTKDSRCGVTMGAVAACLNRGMTAQRLDFNKGRDTAVWLKAEIAKVVDSGKNDIDPDSVVVEVKTVAGPTIQERVREAAMAMTEELETAFESFQENPEAFDPKSFKVLNLLKGKGAKAAHARLIRDFYRRPLAELEELASGADEQLREAYKHRTRKQIKNFMVFLKEIESACTMLMEEAKVVRKVRTPKAVSKDKIVAKLKYKKQDEALKLVSINPVDIVGSKELWVFNTKTRKLGKYVAAEYQDLTVKGTSISGFDESKSVQKTLRKPVEQLAAFKAAGKVALRKFLDDINAVDTALNGRVGEDTLLLKAQ